MIIALVGAVLACSVVFVLSGANYFSEPIVLEETKVIPPGEFVPREQPGTLPPLTSHGEAINLTNEFLREQLGDDYFNDHFNVVGVEKPFERSTWWVVVYDYIYNEYIISLSVSINAGPILKDTSRIDVDFSTVLLEPQEILISEEQAKIIAQKYGLEPPYTIIFSCEVKFHRICWRIGKKDIENLKTDDLAGLLIDAENGQVLDSWVKGT